MPRALLGEIQQLLAAIEATQQQLLELFAKKLAALIGARTDELLTLARSETELANQLTQHLQQRRQILARAHEDGLPSSSIQDSSRLCWK